MDHYDEFAATHRVVATGGGGVGACKRALVPKLCELATELRVVVHPTERDGVPDAVAELPAVAPERAAFGDGVTERIASFPDAERAVEAVLAEMDGDGGLPVTALGFRGDGFEAVVTTSASHAHVGKFDSDDPARVAELSAALAGVGAVVPDAPTVCWERDGTYFELDGPDLCAYAERPASAEDRLYTNHSCYDLTRLAAVDADETAGRIELSWREVDSWVGKALRAVFRPPTGLAVPDAEFEAAATYLDRFVPASEPADSE